MSRTTGHNWLAKHWGTIKAIGIAACFIIVAPLVDITTWLWKGQSISRFLTEAIPYPIVGLIWISGLVAYIFFAGSRGYTGERNPIGTALVIAFATSMGTGAALIALILLAALLLAGQYGLVALDIAIPIMPIVLFELRRLRMSPAQREKVGFILA